MSFSFDLEGSIIRSLISISHRNSWQTNITFNEGGQFYWWRIPENPEKTRLVASH
jgi:hypothetical protein